MNVVRTYSIGSLAAFPLSYASRDAKFLSGYFTASSLVSYVVLPGAIPLGMDPIVSGALNVLTIPVTLGVLTWRNAVLKRRDGEPTTMLESAKSVFSEYRSFAKARRLKSMRRSQLFRGTSTPLRIVPATPL